MTVRIIQGDVREELPKLPADYFDCIVTSPPYYGLRDYGTATWEGGNPACDHRQLGHAPGKETPGGRGGSMPMQEIVFKETCGKCGAIRIDAQIGLEPTIDEYLETMVAVCRELRRVLKPSGVFFCNIGDGYKDKDLCLVPERLGIALQADGWWVRSHIIWAKPNPMPESVTDRPTSAHETIWMLTKNSRYFWDGEAVAEQVDIEYLKARAGGSIERTEGKGDTISRSLPTGKSQTLGVGKNGTRNLRNVWTIPSHPFPGAHFATFPPALVERCIKAGSSERGCCPACGEPWVRVVEYGKPNLDTPQRGSQPYSMAIGGTHRDGKRIGDYAGMPIRTSKTIGWKPSCKCPPDDSVPSRILDPFPGAHFATFPPALVERCIKAGSSERGCCPACGEPWVRVIQTERVRHPHTPGKGGRHNVPGSETSSSSCFRTGLVPINETIGWQPSCECASANTVPSRILDPFAGSGTTGLVADRLGRDCTLIDLNTSYIDMAVNRIRDDAPLFAEVAAE